MKTRSIVSSLVLAVASLSFAAEPPQSRIGTRKPVRVESTKRQTPPKWLVDTFWGHTTDNRARLTLTVRRDGSATAHFVPEDGPSTRYSGHYKSGKLVFGGAVWQVNRSGNDGVRIAQQGRGGMTAILSRNIDTGDNAGSRPPKWLIGEYLGKRSDGADVYLVVYSDGRAMIGFKEDQAREWARVNGNFKAGKLNLGSASYKVSSQSWGVRLWRVGTQTKIDLRRTK